MFMENRMIAECLKNTDCRLMANFDEQQNDCRISGKTKFWLI